MLDLLISRSQILAGYLADAPSSALIEGLDSLANALPLTASALERLLIRGLVGHVLGRVLYSTGLGNRLDIVKALLIWTASSATSDRWRSELVGLIGCCCAALLELDSAASPTRPVADARVNLALRLIDGRFNDPSLARQAFASEMNLSVWHATRLLKNQTGLGFFAHIHKLRVEAAERLLRHGRLSVKEIAVAVGYGSPSQLGRHFRRLRDMTPVEYRRAASISEATT